MHKKSIEPMEETFFMRIHKFKFKIMGIQCNSANEGVEVVVELSSIHSWVESEMSF